MLLVLSRLSWPELWVLHSRTSPMALVLKAMKHSMASKILAAAICILIVPAGYYVLSGLFLVGFEAALADIPGNFIQSIVGAIVGFALSEAVIKAYPPVKSFAW